MSTAIRNEDGSVTVTLPDGTQRAVTASAVTARAAVVIISRWPGADWRVEVRAKPADGAALSKRYRKIGVKHYGTEIATVAADYTECVTIQDAAATG